MLCGYVKGKFDAQVCQKDISRRDKDLLMLLYKTLVGSLEYYDYSCLRKRNSDCKKYKEWLLQ